MEHELTANLGVPLDYNKKEYFEFIWHYEELQEQRKRENADELQQDGLTSLSNLGMNMQDLMNANNNNTG